MKFKSKVHLLEIIRSYRAFHSTDSVDVVTSCTQDIPAIPARITEERHNLDGNQIVPSESTTTCEEPQEHSDHFDLQGDIDTSSDSFFHLSNPQPAITSLSKTSYSDNDFTHTQMDVQTPYRSLAELCGVKPIVPVATIPPVTPVVLSPIKKDTDKQEIKEGVTRCTRNKRRVEEEIEKPRQVKKLKQYPGQCIDLTLNGLSGHDDACEKDEAAVWKFIDRVKLLQIDRDALESETEWITDRIINATQKLLKRKYTILGLQDTLLGQTLRFDEMRNEFVQVLHSGGNHWVTVSTVGCPPSTVNVFDSLSSNIPMHTKEQICTLLKSAHPSIKLQYINTQKQINSSDCGLFALAFTTSICAGKKLHMFEQKGMRLRSHLLRCLEEEDIQPFPSKSVSIVPKTRKIIRTEEIKIYCSCRTQKGGKMVACDGCNEWYHYECLGISQRVTKRSKLWYCTNCENKRQ